MRLALPLAAWIVMHLAACGGSRQPVLSPDAISEAASRSVASVVNISSTRVTQHQQGPGLGQFFGAPSAQQEQSLGSGVIMKASGVVLTNHHVVQDASSITVTLHDGRALNATLLGSDRQTDIAVLQLEGDVSDLRPIEVGDSTQLVVGQIVLAVGNPFGVGQTVTMGIVSAVGRAGMGINQYENFVQTDAAINPGNSGGALVDLEGRLVAINTAIATRTGSYSGVGFAIPSNMAVTLMTRLLTEGKIVRGWLGVRLAELTGKLAASTTRGSADGESSRDNRIQGVVITGVVENGPGHQAGLRPEDIVTRFNGENVSSAAQLRNVIATAGANTEFTLVVVRNGETLTLRGTLSAEPNNPIPDAT